METTEITSIAAIIVSFAALGISIYSARSQAKLKHTLQKNYIEKKYLVQLNDAVLNYKGFILTTLRDLSEISFDQMVALGSEKFNLFAEETIKQHDQVIQKLVTAKKYDIRLKEICETYLKEIPSGNQELKSLVSALLATMNSQPTFGHRGVALLRPFQYIMDKDLDARIGKVLEGAGKIWLVKYTEL